MGQQCLGPAACCLFLHLPTHLAGVQLSLRGWLWQMLWGFGVWDNELSYVISLKHNNTNILIKHFLQLLSKSNKSCMECQLLKHFTLEKLLSVNSLSLSFFSLLFSWPLHFPQCIQGCHWGWPSSGMWESKTNHSFYSTSFCRLPSSRSAGHFIKSPLAWSLHWFLLPLCLCQAQHWA